MQDPDRYFPKPEDHEPGINLAETAPRVPREAEQPASGILSGGLYPLGTPRRELAEYIARLQPGEPVFVLRAQDKFAPELVEVWANKVSHAHDTEQYEAHPAAAVASKTLTSDQRILREGREEKIKDARAIAHEMRAWQCRNRSKLPD